jgi:hypothetical protein
LYIVHGILTVETTTKENKMREFHTYCDDYPETIEGEEKAQGFIIEELENIAEDVKGLDGSENVVNKINGLRLMLDDLLGEMNEKIEEKKND